MIFYLSFIKKLKIKKLKIQIMKCLCKFFQNILLFFNRENKEKDYEVIEDKCLIKEEEYWSCIGGNKHPKSKKICKCYWESINKLL